MMLCIWYLLLNVIKTKNSRSNCSTLTFCLISCDHLCISLRSDFYFIESLWSLFNQWSSNNKIETKELINSYNSIDWNHTLVDTHTYKVRKMNDNARGHLLHHKSNGVYTPTTQPLVSSVVLYIFIHSHVQTHIWICRSSVFDEVIAPIAQTSFGIFIEKFGQKCWN